MRLRGKYIQNTLRTDCGPNFQTPKTLTEVKQYIVTALNTGLNANGSPIHDPTTLHHQGGSESWTQEQEGSRRHPPSGNYCHWKKKKKKKRENPDASQGLNYKKIRGPVFVLQKCCSYKDMATCLRYRRTTGPASSVSKKLKTYINLKCMHLKPELHRQRTDGKRSGTRMENR